MPKQHSRVELLELAARALRAGQFNAAEEFAAKLLKTNRTDTAAISMLAQALIAQKRGEEAITFLEKAVQRGSDASIETLFAVALGSAGRHAEAIEQLRLTTEQRPPFTPAFQQLASQLSQTERLDEAISVAETGLSLVPEAIDLQMDLARLYLNRNQRGKARAMLLRARDAMPGHPEILKALARVLLLDGEYASAADTFRLALAHRPDDVLARADFAACLLEMDERDAGEANLRLAFRSQPQMLARAVHALAASSHGRFFFHKSAVTKFLQDKPA